MLECENLEEIFLKKKYTLYKMKYNNLKNNIIEQHGGNKVTAIACFNPNNDSQIKGTVLFTQERNIVKIEINLSGLTPNHKHGFHVHEAGDLSEKCKSACAHFNPYNKNHGCPGKEDRHVGDLGNIKTDKDGKANYSMEDDIIKLNGEANIIGRALIIHKDTDDCGEGIGDKQKSSLITGNSGDRIACAIIGYSKYNFIKSE
jgi:Cu-Zn family superoxide dismutase